MAVTGLALVLFLTFHGSMNVVAVFSGKAYNAICEFLGANWYAVVATIGLAALALFHIVYAFILNAQNRRARGNNRYEVTSKPEKVEWASQNMLVLGIIILLGLGLHLYNFWYKMMFAELFDTQYAAQAANGILRIQQTFSCPVYCVIYILWIAAIWFHLSHGFWSSMQTLGWNGNTWQNRWKMIGLIYVTLLCLMFIFVVVAFWTGIAPLDGSCGCGGCCGGVCGTCGCGEVCDCATCCKALCKDACEQVCCVAL